MLLVVKGKEEGEREKGTNKARAMPEPRPPGEQPVIRALSIAILLSGRELEGIKEKGGTK